MLNKSFRHIQCPAMLTMSYHKNWVVSVQLMNYLQKFEWPKYSSSHRKKSPFSALIYKEAPELNFLTASHQPFNLGPVVVLYQHKRLNLYEKLWLLRRVDPLFQIMFWCFSAQGNKLTPVYSLVSGLLSANIIVRIPQHWRFLPRHVNLNTARRWEDRNG